MGNDEHVQKIQSIYASFAKGDLAAITAQLTDDVEWITHLPTSVPWSGNYSGRDNVPNFFAAIFNSVEVTAFEIGDFVSHGDTVVSLGKFGCRINASGKELLSDWVFIWKFEGDLVASYEQFHDEKIAAAFSN